MPWEFVGRSTNYPKVRSIHRLYTTLYKKYLDSMEKFLFCITPHTREIKWSAVECHTSKNIFKMIKQGNQSRQVEIYLYYHKNDKYWILHVKICITCIINPRTLYHPKGHRPEEWYRSRVDTASDTDFDM